MTNKIQILDATSQSIIGEIEVEDAYINERINDTYTFDFSCYEQTNTNLLAQETLIYVDNDYFRIANIDISPVEGRYDVSCEHISYELNVITKEEDEEDAEDLRYEGKLWDIIDEILDGTNFVYFHSDDINDTFKFVTRQKGKRSRILEFCVKNKLEVHWFRYQVSIQKRRGADNGLVIELGENLRDLKIKKRFQFNGEIETTYDIDFIDLNKIKDEQGNPLKPNEFHMGDTVHLRYKGKSEAQRGKAVGYNPFKRALPTIELENLVRDITEVIADGAVASGQSNGGTFTCAELRDTEGVIAAVSRVVDYRYYFYQEILAKPETGVTGTFFFHFGLFDTTGTIAEDRAIHFRVGLVFGNMAGWDDAYLETICYPNKYYTINIPFAFRARTANTIPSIFFDARFEDNGLTCHDIFEIRYRDTDYYNYESGFFDGIRLNICGVDIKVEEYEE